MNMNLRPFLICLTLLMPLTRLSAQQTMLEKYNMPVYNFHTGYLNEFSGKQPLVVIPDDTAGFANHINYSVARLTGNSSPEIKSEKNLTGSDFKRPLLILGPIQKFHRWSEFSLPVAKTAGGFSCAGHSFEGPEYSFTYVSDSISEPARIVASGNSEKTFTEALNRFSSGFSFIAYRKDVAAVFGNFPDRIVNMDFVKKDHYDTTEIGYFRFHMSKNMDAAKKSELENRYASFDQHVEAFCKKMQLELPEEKIDAYIHADQTEIAYACGFFEGINGGKIWGFQNEDQIHAYRGFGALKHETNHILFDQVNSKAPTFLTEGIQTWYENFEKPSNRDKCLKKAHEFIDEDMAEVILTGYGFHDGDKYYKISGIFVNYLLETYGLDKFKELYGHNYREEETAYLKTYGLPFAEILGSYKEWLSRQGSTPDRNIE